MVLNQVYIFSDIIIYLWDKRSNWSTKNIYGWVTYNRANIIVEQFLNQFWNDGEISDIFLSRTFCPVCIIEFGHTFAHANKKPCGWVVVVLGPWFWGPSLVYAYRLTSLVYAYRLTNGVWGSRARKSVMVQSQITLITWPIIHLLFTGMSVAPEMDVNASLRSYDKKLTTAHESKQSRIFQLVNRS